MAPSLDYHHSIFFTLFVGPIPVTRCSFFFPVPRNPNQKGRKKKKNPDHPNPVKEERKKKREETQITEPNERKKKKITQKPEPNEKIKKVYG